MRQLDAPVMKKRTLHWIKSKNPDAPAVKREAEEVWTTEGLSGRLEPNWV
jgi:hypothetical protein